MRDSDDDYVQSASEDEGGARNAAGGKKKKTTIKSSAAAGGFEVNRTWENIDEAADGTISGAVEELLDAGKRRRVLKDTTPIQRGIIRHLVLILDLSASMVEKDLRPTRYLLTLRYAAEFVTEYFEQNPISQLCIIGMRDGLAVPVTDMGGNPLEHINTLTALRKQEPKGDASLQNAFNMARGALYHAPSHGTREILLIFGSLLSSDPDDIHKTIGELVQSRITATVVGLAAEVAICRILVTRTNPQLAVADAYGVALNEQHYRELFMRATTPPATGSSGSNDVSGPVDDGSNAASLLMMGFPSRSVETGSSLCACHSKPTRAGYTCSRCSSKVCGLPTTCPVCSLTLILSTHLARSYHHLFPLRNWLEVSWTRARRRRMQGSCFGCLADFPAIPDESKEEKGAEAEMRRLTVGHQKERDRGVSESGRYECETCGIFLCIDCDVFAHEVVHNCPGCQSTAVAGDGTAAEQAPTGDVVMGGTENGPAHKKGVNGTIVNGGG